MIIAFLFTLLLSHPLDNGVMNSFDGFEINNKITYNHIYVSPINGVVENIEKDNNKYNIKISNENTELLFVGIDDIYKSEGDAVTIGDEIGRDYSINNYTCFLTIQYDNANLFPQMNNNKLYFKTPLGTPIYSMLNGKVTIIDFDMKSGRGSYFTSVNDEENIVVEYRHLLVFRVSKDYIILKKEIVGYTGNTGLSWEPNLTIHIYDEYRFDDYKVIYIKNKSQ